MQHKFPQVLRSPYPYKIYVYTNMCKLLLINLIEFRLLSVIKSEQQKDLNVCECVCKGVRNEYKSWKAGNQHNKHHNRLHPCNQLLLANIPPKSNQSASPLQQQQQQQKPIIKWKQRTNVAAIEIRQTKIILHLQWKVFNKPHICMCKYVWT